MNQSEEPRKERSKRIWLGVLNVAAHPHPPGVYKELLEEAAKITTPIRLKGELHAMVATALAVDANDPDSPVEGFFLRFTELGPETTWANVGKRVRASLEEIQEISIPSNLRPHARDFRYVFFPSTHRLVFVSTGPGGKIAHESVRRLFEGALNKAASKLRGEGAASAPETVAVTVQPENESITEILNLAEKKFLAIEIKRPNSGDVDPSSEQEILEQLEGENVDKMTLELTAQSEKSIEPSARTKKLILAGASNGFVRVKGKDARGRTRHISTDERPLKEAFLLSPKFPGGIVPWLRKVAESLVSRLTGGLESIAHPTSMPEVMEVRVDSRKALLPPSGDEDRRDGSPSQSA